MEVYAKWPSKAQGTIRPGKTPASSAWWEIVLLGELMDRSMSWVASRRVDLHNPTSCKTCFYNSRGWEVHTRRPPGRKMFERIGIWYSHTSRADKKVFCPKDVLKGAVKQKERMGVGTVIKKASDQSGHHGVSLVYMSNSTNVQCFVCGCPLIYTVCNYSEVNCEMNFKGWTLLCCIFCC